jgi:hypothetical protein
MTAVQLIVDVNFQQQLTRPGSVDGHRIDKHLHSAPDLSLP